MQLRHILVIFSSAVLPAQILYADEVSPLQLFNQGGTSSGHLTSLIVGGEKAHEHHFFVKVRITRKDGTGKLCGGSLIRTKWVLTAASCFRSAREVWVETGVFWATPSHRQMNQVEKVITHPQYKSGSVPRNNIALLKLLFPQPVYKTLPVCSEDISLCMFMTACGMGSVSGSSYEPSRELLQMHLVQSTGGIFKPCPKEYICTRPVYDGSNICDGDNGGPLFIYHDNVAIPKCVYGVASYAGQLPFNRNRCNGGSYFTSVLHFKDWIAETIQRNN